MPLLWKATATLLLDLEKGGKDEHACVYPEDYEAEDEDAPTALTRLKDRYAGFAGHVADRHRVPLRISRDDHVRTELARSAAVIGDTVASILDAINHVLLFVPLTAGRVTI